MCNRNIKIGGLYMKKLFLFPAIILFLITACGGDIATDIIGKWECLRLKQVLQFDPVGGVELIDTKVGYGRYVGTYSIQGKKIIFTFPRFSRPIERKVKSISVDKLILLDKNNIEEVYLKR